MSLDRRERITDPVESSRLVFESNQSKVWTAIPGFVVKFPGGVGQMTVNVKPTIMAKVTKTDGSFVWTELPVLLDCPVLWQGGGGVTATFPIKASSINEDGTVNNDGDECLVLFSSRCIDGWWQKGGISNQPVLRMHDLSDGFALIGVRSLPNEFSVDTENACLISDDQDTFIKLNPTSKAIAMTANGGINLNGVTIDEAGNIVSPTTIKAATVTGTTDVIAGATNISAINHEHTSESPGSPTSPPIAGT